MTKTAPTFHAPGLDTITLSESGVAMPFRLPNGSPLNRLDGVQAEAVLYGPDSSHYRLAMAELRKAATDFASANPDATPEEKDAAEVQRTAVFLGRMTKSWNVQLTDGSEAPLDTAPAFYAAFPAARDQADAFIGARVRFMKAS